MHRSTTHALVLAAAFLAAPMAHGTSASAPARALLSAGAETGRAPLILARRTCGDARSCREAVIMWCNGYRRADGDGDGIPCERVCRSRAQVNEIRREIGC